MNCQSIQTKVEPQVLAVLRLLKLLLLLTDQHFSSEYHMRHPRLKWKHQCSPSFNMPTFRHFMKRHAWQDLRLLLVISHSLVAGQLYSIFPAEEKKKKHTVSWMHISSQDGWFKMHQIADQTEHLCVHTYSAVQRWPRVTLLKVKGV